MCFWFWGKKKEESWSSWFNLQLCSSAAFSRISASATVACICSCFFSSTTYLCPFAMTFSHILCQNIYILLWSLSFPPDLLHFQVDLDVFPYLEFLDFSLVF